MKSEFGINLSDHKSAPPKKKNIKSIKHTTCHYENDINEHFAINQLQSATIDLQQIIWHIIARQLPQPL